jgi:hypothetical protein
MKTANNSDYGRFNFTGGLKYTDIQVNWAAKPMILTAAASSLV